MDWGELMNSAWFWVVTAISGISLPSLIGMIVYVVVRGRIVKELAKINTEKIVADVSGKAIEGVIGSVKELSFKQSIQPVVEKELKKILIEVQDIVNEELGAVKKRYDDILAVLEGLAKYFDNSIGVTDEAKAELRKAIEEAHKDKIEPEIVEEIKVEEIIVDKPKTENKAEKTENKAHIDR